MRVWLVLVALLSLGACVETTSLPPLPAAKGQEVAAARNAKTQAAARAKVALFSQVAAKLEPVAQKMCRTKAAVKNCNFQITLDTRPGLPANAYQTLDAQGRPVIAFTLALLADVRNADEVAFVLGHEAAHHVLGHIAKQERLVREAALSAGLRTAAHGGSIADVAKAQRGAAANVMLGYAKDYELQADETGTEIAFRAGFNPLRGAAFFDRLPNPARGRNSTHPRNSVRKALVAKTVARMKG